MVEVISCLVALRLWFRAVVKVDMRPVGMMRLSPAR
jgi:hypothetical protein